MLLLGLLTCLIMALRCCAQVGTVMVRWVSRHCDPVMATGWHMVLGSLPLAALSLALEGDELLPRLAQIDGALCWLCI